MISYTHLKQNENVQNLCEFRLLCAPSSPFANVSRDVLKINCVFKSRFITTILPKVHGIAKSNQMNQSEPSIHRVEFPYVANLNDFTNHRFRIRSFFYCFIIFVWFNLIFYLISPFPFNITSDVYWVDVHFWFVLRCCYCGFLIACWI